MPRGTLNREVIVAAAASILDADGLEALTMSRLAEELGVRPMSLYTHFRDKDAILSAVSGELYTRFEMPTAASSDLDLLRKLMHAYFKLLRDHPALLQLDDAIEENPAEAKVTDAIYGCMHRMGIGHRSAVGLVATLLRFVMGCAYVYPTRRHWDEDPQHWARVRERWRRLPAEVYPAMHEMSSDFPEFTQQETFEFGLETLLEAVATRAERESKSLTDAKEAP